MGPIELVGPVEFGLGFIELEGPVALGLAVNNDDFDELPTSDGNLVLRGEFSACRFVLDFESWTSGAVISPGPGRPL